jgi:hypothetical protein
VLLYLKSVLLFVPVVATCCDHRHGLKFPGWTYPNYFRVLSRMCSSIAVVNSRSSLVTISSPNSNVSKQPSSVKTMVQYLVVEEKSYLKISPLSRITLVTSWSILLRSTSGDITVTERIISAISPLPLYRAPSFLCLDRKKI